MSKKKLKKSEKELSTLNKFLIVILAGFVLVILSVFLIDPNNYFINQIDNTFGILFGIIYFGLIAYILIMTGFCKDFSFSSENNSTGKRIISIFFGLIFLAIVVLFFLPKDSVLYEKLSFFVGLFFSDSGEYSHARYVDLN